MLLGAYSVYDECTETYGTPFFVVNDKTAERAFFQLWTDPNSTVFQSPKDFSLYYIGQFDDSDGAITKSSNPRLIRRADQYAEER